MQRLSRWLSRSSVVLQEADPTIVVPSCSVAQLLDLPTEIFFIIETYLLYENVIALSLTCKTAYELLFKRHKPTTRHHGREANFLRLLERQTPNLLSCPIHERLYAWRREKSKHYQCPLCTANNRVASGSLVICNKGCKTAFYGIFEPERRLILRDTILGHDYGIPRRTLDHVCKKSLSKKVNEVISKVVDGSLMLWRTHHYTVRVDFQQWSDLQLDHVDEAVCLHTELGIRALISAAIVHARKSRSGIVKSASKPWDRLEQQVNWECPILFKCAQCSTDMRLHVDQISANGIVVRFDVYQDLGGLLELSMAQRQVLGLKHDWRQQDLSKVDKMSRLRSDLEKQFHGEAEAGENDVSGIPPDVGFITQWLYSFRRNTEDPVIFRPDPIIPKEIWEKYESLPFRIATPAYRSS